MGLLAGSEGVTLTTQQIPGHTHSLQGTTTTATTRDPVPGNIPATASGDAYNQAPDLVPLNGQQAIMPTGGSQPHENTQPFLCINFIISLFGVYPSQT